MGDADDKGFRGMPGKRCFVIAPIGPEGSPTRRNSDDAFELLIEPALEVFDFTVIRADRILGSGPISLEIIELIQNAELCVIDLSEPNPNVYYEAGRRHETGKPFIQIVRQGVDLPFDLVGVRTIEYNLTDVRSTRSSMQELRRHAQVLEDAGYVGEVRGVSMLSLAQAIDRIDRKLDRLAPSGAVDVSTVDALTGGVGSAERTLEDLMRSPTDAFLRAISVGDTDRAVAVLRHVRRTAHDPAKIVAFAGLLAAQGEQEGADAILDLLRSDGRRQLADDTALAAVSSLVRYYVVTDREREGIDELLPLIESRMSDETIDVDSRASLENQLQMLYWGAQEYGPALEHGLNAIKLNPDESAYKYNVSMIYEAEGDLKKAEIYVDDFMSSEKSRRDADHLSQAIDIYMARGRFDDVRSCFTQLKAVDSSKASVKAQFDDRLRRVVEL